MILSKDINHCIKSHSFWAIRKSKLEIKMSKKAIDLFNKNIVRFQNAYHVTVIKHIHVANYIIKQLIVLIIYKRQILHVQCYKSLFFFSIFFSNVISFIQMLATINTPKVQAPFGVSLLHPVLIIQGYNQNYMKYIQPKYNFYLIPFGNIYLFSIYCIIFYFH